MGAQEVIPFRPRDREAVRSGLGIGGLRSGCRRFGCGGDPHGGPVVLAPGRAADGRAVPARPLAGAPALETPPTDLRAHRPRSIGQASTLAETRPSREPVRPKREPTMPPEWPYRPASRRHRASSRHIVQADQAMPRSIDAVAWGGSRSSPSLADPRPRPMAPMRDHRRSSRTRWAPATRRGAFESWRRRCRGPVPGRGADHRSAPGPSSVEK